MSVNNTVTFSVVTDALAPPQPLPNRKPASRADHRVLVWSGVVGWAAEGAAKTVTRFEVSVVRGVGLAADVGRGDPRTQRTRRCPNPETTG